MIRLTLNWITYGAWSAGIGKTALDLISEHNVRLSGMPFLLALSGLIYGIVRIINSLLNGIIDREGKKLDNLLKEQELWADMQKEIEDEKGR